MVEQTAVEHYKSKIAAENEKLQRAEEVANDVQTEFQVGVLRNRICLLADSGRTAG